MAFGTSRWFAATEQGLIFSDDRGVNWATLPLGPLPDLPVQSVHASRDARSLWVVSLRGMVFSRDGGTTWKWHDLPLSAGGALRLDLPNSERDGGTLVAAAQKGLFISRDGGNTWIQAAAGLPSAPVQDFALVGDVFFASPRVGGLYMSEDAGRSWRRVHGALAEALFPVLAADSQANLVLAASAGDGLYAISFGAMEGDSLATLR
jgi:hypothetical protein